MRNIINTEAILSFLHSISIQKKLDNYPHLKKWLFSNARKYIINNEPLDENFDLKKHPNILEHISRYGITTPVHFLKLDHILKDKINHILDFLKSDYSDIKDVSRISFPQAIISAEQWLQKRLKKISQEEDFINTKPFLDTTGLDNKTYTWVKINSKKGICREASIMRHCIESYWDEHYGNQEVADNETPFYSLRDEDNKSVLTAYIKKENSICVIEEIKERFNNLLDFNHIPCVDFLAQYLINDNNISEVHITDESVSQWFNHKIMTKQGKNSSIIDCINKDDFFKKPISQNQFNLLRKYFPAKKLYNSLILSELSIDSTNYVNGVVYHAEKLEVKNLNNQEISFFSNDVIFDNNKNCIFNEIWINEQLNKKEIKNKFNFKKNSDCSVVLSLNNNKYNIFLSECEQVHFLTHDQISLKHYININTTLCDNISCDPSIKKYNITMLDNDFEIKTKYFSDNILKNGTTYMSPTYIHHYFLNQLIFNDNLNIFMNYPFMPKGINYLNNLTVSNEVKIMNSLTSLQFFENLFDNPSGEVYIVSESINPNNTFHRIFDIKQFLTQKESYIENFISHTNLEDLETHMLLDKILPVLLFSTENYEFSNGLEKKISDYFLEQKNKILPFIKQQEMKFKEYLENEQYPLGHFLKHLESLNSLSFDLITIECLKNMMIRICDKDEYFKKETNTFTERISQYIFNTTIQKQIASIKFETNKDFMSQKTQLYELTSDDKLNLMVLQSSLIKNHCMIVNDILNSEYNPKFDITLDVDNTQVKKNKIKI